MPLLEASLVLAGEFAIRRRRFLVVAREQPSVSIFDHGHLLLLKRRRFLDVHAAELRPTALCNLAKLSGLDLAPADSLRRLGDHERQNLICPVPHGTQGILREAPRHNLASPIVFIRPKARGDTQPWSHLAAHPLGHTSGPLRSAVRAFFTRLTGHESPDRRTQRTADSDAAVFAQRNTEEAGVVRIESNLGRLFRRPARENVAADGGCRHASR